MVRDSLAAAKATKRVFAPAWLLTDGSILDFGDTTKNGSSAFRVGEITTLMSSDVRERRRQDLEPEILFVAETVGPSLDDPDLCVQAFDKAEGDLVLGIAVGGGVRAVDVSSAKRPGADSPGVCPQGLSHFACRA